MLKKIWGAVKKALEPFSNVMNNIINFILLSVVYFAGIGVVSVCAKIFGNHFLELKKQNRKSGWRPHKLGKEALEKYYRTF